jgi:hypothetical protein
MDYFALELLGNVNNVRKKEERSQALLPNFRKSQIRYPEVRRLNP